MTVNSSPSVRQWLDQIVKLLEGVGVRRCASCLKWCMEPKVAEPLAPSTKATKMPKRNSPVDKIEKMKRRDLRSVG